MEAQSPALLRKGSCSFQGMLQGTQLCCPEIVSTVFMSMLFLSESLLDLMSTVVKMCPSVCESSHFAVLLGTYRATLSILGEEDLMARLCGQS